MDEHTLLPNRGRIDADVDMPDAHLTEAEHVDWMIDEAVEETFPASDPPTHIQPGSIAGLLAEREAQCTTPPAGSARSRNAIPINAAPASTSRTP